MIVVCLMIPSATSCNLSGINTKNKRNKLIHIRKNKNLAWPIYIAIFYRLIIIKYATTISKCTQINFLQFCSSSSLNWNISYVYVASFLIFLEAVTRTLWHHSIVKVALGPYFRPCCCSFHAACSHGNQTPPASDRHQPWNRDPLLCWLPQRQASWQPKSRCQRQCCHQT